MKKIGIVLLLIAVLITAASVYGYNMYDKVVNIDKIYEGITIAGIDVTNLTKAEALKKVAENYSGKTGSLNINFHELHFTFPYKTLGYESNFQEAVDTAYNLGREGHAVARLVEVINLKNNPVDIEVTEKFDDTQVGIAVDLMSQDVNTAPINANFKIENGDVVITPEINGRNLDTEGAKKAILDSLNNGGSAELPIVETKAEFTTESFARMNGIIGQFTSNYGSSVKNRKENIKLAAKKLSGLLVLPGEQISFNQTVGDISASTGYLPAGVIINGEFDTGIGGGICQVSTTMYNALVRADIQIDERRNHSRPVNYVPLGTDCAVASGYLDLKFTNSFDFPIYITTEADNSSITFYVLGDKNTKDYDIDIVSERVEVIKSKVVETPSSALAEGVRETTQKGNDGYRYRTFKVISRNGEQVSREVYNTSYYPMRNTLITVGTRKPVVAPVTPTTPTTPTTPAPSTPTPAPEPAPEVTVPVIAP